MDKLDIIGRLDEVPIVGIVRNMTEPQADLVADSCRQAGLHLLEVTLNTENAIAIIAALAKKYSGSLCIGAGTVLSMKDLANALEAGAAFIITPVVNREVIRTCADEGIPVFPGAMTPTEILEAWDLGATAVKVFPASNLGNEYFKAIAAPLNHVTIMATGGITADNMASFWDAGVRYFGIGSPLFPKEYIHTDGADKLIQHLSTFVQQVRSLKKEAGHE